MDIVVRNELLDRDKGVYPTITVVWAENEQIVSYHLLAVLANKITFCSFSATVICLSSIIQ